MCPPSANLYTSATVHDVPADLLGPSGEVGHREHIHLAWRGAPREHDRAVALDRIEAAIRHVAAAHGAPDKYHRTITETWVALVHHHLTEAPTLGFDELLARSGLLDPGLLGRHFSRELLAAPAAREGSVAPDLRPLPAHG